MFRATSCHVANKNKPPKEKRKRLPKNANLTLVGRLFQILRRKTISKRTAHLIYVALSRAT